MLIAQDRNQIASCYACLVLRSGWTLPTMRAGPTNLYFCGIGAARHTDYSRPAVEKSLQRNTNGDTYVRISGVVHVVPVVLVDDINIVGLIPVVCPRVWPGIDHTEPIASVLKARESTHHHVRLVVDDEPIAWAEVAVVAVLRDAVSVIAATLLPVAVVGLPVL